MIRRDFLLVKIREFAAVLAKIMGFRHSADYVVSLSSVDHILEQWFGIDSVFLSGLTPDILQHYLADKYQDAEVYDLVGTLLHERGLCFLSLGQHAEAMRMFGVAKYLLQLADERVGTFNNDRNLRLHALGLALSDEQKN